MQSCIRVIIRFCLIWAGCLVQPGFAEVLPNANGTEIEAASAAARDTHSKRSPDEVNPPTPAVVAIAHPSTDLSALNTNELRAIFSLRVRNWPNGQPIRVIIREEKHATSLAFIREVLRMLPHQLRRQWDRVIFSGLGQGPLVVQSEQDMLNQVANTPGAVGYTTGGVSHEGVRILHVD